MYSVFQGHIGATEKGEHRVTEKGYTGSNREWVYGEQHRRGIRGATAKGYKGATEKGYGGATEKGYGVTENGNISISALIGGLLEREPTNRLSTKGSINDSTNLLGFGG